MTTTTLKCDQCGSIVADIVLDDTSRWLMLAKAEPEGGLPPILIFQRDDYDSNTIESTLEEADFLSIDLWFDFCGRECTLKFLTERPDIWERAE